MLRLVACCVLPAVLYAQIGYRDTPVIAGQPWRLDDLGRPHPRMVAPGSQAGDPPSGAIVLFDGRDLFKGARRGKGVEEGKTVDSRYDRPEK